MAAPLTAFKPVFIVADEAQIEITAEPMSSQLQRLAEGMDAAVVLSSYPGKELKAKIEQLPYPYGKGGGSLPPMWKRPTSCRTSLSTPRISRSSRATWSR